MAIDYAAFLKQQLGMPDAEFDDLVRQPPPMPFGPKPWEDPSLAEPFDATKYVSQSVTATPQWGAEVNPQSVAPPPPTAGISASVASPPAPDISASVEAPYQYGPGGTTSDGRAIGPDGFPVERRYTTPDKPKGFENPYDSANAPKPPPAVASQSMLETNARAAWFKQTGGAQGGPENAPREYIESWKGAWRTGKDVEGARAYNAGLQAAGHDPKAVQAAVDYEMRQYPKWQAELAKRPPQGLDPKQLATQGKALADLVRNDQNAKGNYVSEEQYQKWYQAACGAASFATLYNAVSPNKMSVGQAVQFLSGKGLIDPNVGLKRGSDFTDVATAMNEAAGGEVAMAVNLKTPGSVQEHFARGGGPIMVTGPSQAVWGVAHIYVITGADANGVQIMDSSRANKTALTWGQYQAQTGVPGSGAGVALLKAPAAAAAEHGAATTRVTPNVVEGRRPGPDGLMEPDSGGKVDNSSREAFITSILPYAQQVSQETGIPASILIAIPLNEQGWQQPAPGNNYFGIKGSNPRTGANTGPVATWEDYGGGRTNIQDTFRAYDNPAESFRDFAQFLRDNPRYAGALRILEQTGDGAAFIRAVHAAGYATDPQWSNKILNIASGVGR
jgi:flagellum-specific peptidoglycan hydrolase FlgJ